MMLVIVIVMVMTGVVREVSLQVKASADGRRRRGLFIGRRVQGRLQGLDLQALVGQGQIVLRGGPGGRSGRAEDVVLVLVLVLVVLLQGG